MLGCIKIYLAMCVNLRKTVISSLTQLYISKVALSIPFISALTIGEECRDVDDCTHVECPEDDYELECVRESCTCTHGKSDTRFHSHGRD